MTRRLNQRAGNLLNMREDEVPLVGNFFFLNFFQGIGLAFFFTTANALFLAEYKVIYLTYVYMASAVLLLFSGRIYAYLEERLPMKKLMPAVLLFLAISPLVFLYGTFALKAIWLPFVLMMWHRLMYLLNNLEFWGISAVVFDVRQSKRLFGLISAGDKPAKLLGYLAVSALVPFIGIENLLIISSLSFFAAFLVFRKLDHIIHSKIEGEHEHYHREERPTGGLTYLKKFFGNNFIFVISSLSFLVIIALTFIDYSFLTGVKHKFKTEEEFANFFGLFFGLGNAITIVTKLFFSGRIINQIGIKKALMVLPGLLLITSLCIILTGFFTSVEQVYFWLFGIMMLISEVFKYSLHEPVFLTLFQPLNRHQRLHGHTIVKGFIDPIGLGIAGLILAGFTFLHGGIDLQYSNYFLFALIAGWIVTVLFTSHRYVEVLKSAINHRILAGSEIAVSDRATLKIIYEKIESDYPEDIISALELLEKLHDKHDLEQLVIKLLHHQSREVRIFALKKVGKDQIKAAEESLKTIIENSSDEEEKEIAIRAYSKIAEDAIEFLFPYLDSSSGWVKRGTITGLLKSGGVEATVMAGQKLLEFTTSKSKEDKILAAQIIGDLEIKNFYRPILRFLNDDSDEVKTEAIISAGKIKNQKLLPELISFVKNPGYQNVALNALVAYQDQAVPVIADSMKNGKVNSIKLPILLVQALGGIRSSNSISFLLQQLKYPAVKVRLQVVRSLRRLDFVAAEHQKPLIEEVLEDEFNRINFCRAANYKSLRDSRNDLFLNSLVLEINLSKENIFLLLSFLFESKPIIKAHETLMFDDREEHANALEMLENLLPRRWYVLLLPVLEDVLLHWQTNRLEKHDPNFRKSKLEFLTEIIFKGKSSFTRLTVATAINELPETINRNLLEKLIEYALNEDTIISEASIIKLRELNKNAAKALEELSPVNRESFNHSINKEMSKLLEIEKILVLKGTSLFSETPENILVDVASIVEEKRYNEGEEVFKKGDIGNSMYIIFDGEIKIHDNELVFAYMKNRDFFGELAILDPEPRSATATASKASLLLRIDQEPFYELMTTRPEVSSGIMKIIARRLRKQNQKISDLQKTASQSIELENVDQ